MFSKVFFALLATALAVPASPLEVRISPSHTPPLVIQHSNATDPPELRADVYCSERRHLLAHRVNQRSLRCSASHTEPLH
jgi:hypothetical protein